MYNTQIIPTRFFGLDRFMDAFNGDNANLPRAAVVEKDGVYTLEIDLPGVKKENIGPCFLSKLEDLAGEDKIREYEHFSLLSFTGK